MKKVSILNLNKHIEKKTLFLVFVQSPAVSLLLVLSCLLVMAEGTFFIDYWIVDWAQSLFFFAKLLQEKPKHASRHKGGRKPEKKK